MWRFSEAAGTGTWRLVGLHNPELSLSAPLGHISRIGVLSSRSRGGREVSPEEGRRRNGGGILVPLHNSRTAHEPGPGQRPAPEHQVTAHPATVPDPPRGTGESLVRGPYEQLDPTGEGRVKGLASACKGGSCPHGRSHSRPPQLSPTAVPRGRPRSCEGSEP